MRGRGPGLLAIVGGAAVLAGVVGLAVLGWWNAEDRGWTGNGAFIRFEHAPFLTPAVVPVAAVLVGTLTVLLRREVPVRSVRGVLLAVTSAFVAGAVVPAVDLYPQVEPARLFANFGQGWEVTLPLVSVRGVREETDDRITIEGEAASRGCRFELRSVTIDLDTGEILSVHPLPTFFPSPSDIPPDPDPLDLSRFYLESGSRPIGCSS